MAKAVIYTIIVILLLSLSIVFPKIGASAPNFLFLLAVVYAFRKDDSDYLWLAFFSGLALDLYTNTFLGIFALSFLIVAFIINYTTRTFFSSDLSLVYIGVIVTLAYLLVVGLVYIINSISSRFGTSLPISGEYLTVKIWVDLLLNLVFVAPMYFLSLFNDRIINHYSKDEGSF
ncbi:MAG: rod shape-determining protein MreD [Candidatus Doudnabacteria bacterium]